MRCGAPLLHTGVKSRKMTLAAICLLTLGILCLPAHTSAWHRNARQSAASDVRPSRDFSGSTPSRDSGRLHLKTPLGNIVIHQHDSATIDYHVHLETDTGTKDATRLLHSFGVRVQPSEDGVVLVGVTTSRVPAGRLWVTLDVTIPRNFSLDVGTGVGNITATEDLVGHQMLVTQGGNIVAGNINGSAHLTAVAGGHISVKNVSGELVAETGGGHIMTGAVGGNAFLHTHGGHIRAGSIAGIAHLVTDGGNITLEHAGADIIAETAGGQIQVGEAAGVVRAKTDGGGIRVARTYGAANLQSADGSIYLTQADGAVKASTATGGITAWLVSPSKDSGQCDLQSTKGDIVVYLGRNLPVTIDAQVQMGDTHGFIIDPDIPLVVHYDDGTRGERIAHAEGALNGGGEVLHVRTVSGNIRFVLGDADKQMEMFHQQMEGMQKQIDQMQKNALP